MKISARAFQRVFPCKIWLRIPGSLHFSFLLREGLFDLACLLACLLRYSRERALKSSEVRALGNLTLNFEILKLLFAAQRTEDDHQDTKHENE